jgi:primosomal protein N' (replication factor Y) (superfamily II helicase)
MPDPTVFVDVAVPFPILQLFTYAVPDELRERACPGVRAIVPFGRRQVTGLVIRTNREARPEAKSLGAILDREPLLSCKLLDLGLWLSSYYLAPPGEAYRIMLPPGLLSRSVLADSFNRWPVRKQKAVVSVEPGPGGAELTPRQRELLEQLQATSLPLLMADAARQGLSLSMVTTLQKKGLLRIGETEIERSPWSSTHVQEGDVSKHSLSPDQLRVFQRLQQGVAKGVFQSILLHGVTGSGKTEVYLNAIDAALAQGKSALLLVPEIGLTPQVARYFQRWFGEEAAIMHSGLSDGERFDQWRRIREGDAKVVIGTRSALFAPLRNLSLIIVDEEHDSSYKQEETPRYHARDTAIKRAQIEDAVVVLGSATPQLETYYLASKRGQYGYEPLAQRIQDRPLPTVRVVDMRTEFQTRGRASIISSVLEMAIADRLAGREQVLILLNRRGYSPLLMCRSCGSTETCESCSISLTYHQDINRLTCHYCGFQRKVPENCRSCGKQYIQFIGEGTERIEEILKELFPNARIGRLDRDTVARRGSIAGILGDFGAGKTELLVGTQMIAKGHDFPGVTLVGVLAAEQSLRLDDFRAAERTFQLLTQVAGRAGRGDRPGEVIIQTYFPNHYSVKYACAQDYAKFFQEEIKFRFRFRYPPYTALANLLFFGKDRERTERLAHDFSRILTEERNVLSDEKRMRFLGPAPAPRERLRGEYRFQLLIKTTNRAELHRVLNTAFDRLGGQAGIRGVSIDVDPISLL